MLRKYIHTSQTILYVQLIVLYHILCVGVLYIYIYICICIRVHITNAYTHTTSIIQSKVCIYMLIYISKLKHISTNLHAHKQTQTYYTCICVYMTHPCLHTLCKFTLIYRSDSSLHAHLQTQCLHL